MLGLLQRGDVQRLGRGALAHGAQLEAGGALQQLDLTESGARVGVARVLDEGLLVRGARAVEVADLDRVEGLLVQRRQGGRGIRLLVLTRVAHRHRQRAHALDDAVTVGGIRVTNPIRTAVDCARTLDIDEALVIVNGVLDELARPVPWRRAAGDAAIAEVRARMVALLDAEPRTRGNARARLVLDIADGWAESPLESLLLRVLLLLGLPRPRLQVDPKECSRFSHPTGPSLCQAE